MLVNGGDSTVATKFTLVYGPLFPILQGRLQSWIVTIHEDNVPNNTVVNASKPINFGRYFEWMPKLQTLAETYQKATKNKVTWPLKAGKQTKQETQPLQVPYFKQWRNTGIAQLRSQSGALIQRKQKIGVSNTSVQLVCKCLYEGHELSQG